MADVDAPPDSRRPLGLLTRPRAFGFLVWGLLVAALWVWTSYSNAGAPKDLSYSAFKAAVAAGEVVSCTVGPEEIWGTLRRPPESGDRSAEGAFSRDEPAPVDAESPTETAFRTTRVQDPGLLEDLRAAGVEVTGGRASGWLRLLLSWLLPMGLLVFVWLYVLRRGVVPPRS